MQDRKRGMGNKCDTVFSGILNELGSTSLCAFGDLAIKMCNVKYF